MEIAIGLIIGLVLGLTGAGGSVFAVPSLILVLGLSAPEAMGISLGAVSVSALVGTFKQRGNILWWPALLLAVGGMLAAPFGKWLSLYVDQFVLICGFTVVALVIAFRMFFQAQYQVEISFIVRGSMPTDVQKSSRLTCKLSPSGQFQLRPRCLSGLIIGGIVIGLASGLFGVGGGFLIVPLLVFLSAISMTTAVATSLAVIALVSGSGFIAHGFMTGVDDLNLLFRVLIAAIAGMYLSGPLGKFIAGPNLQKVFAGILAVASIVLVTTQFML